MTRTLEKQGAAFIVIATLLSVGLMVASRGLFPSAARWLMVAAGLQSLIVFIGLSWALTRSDIVFYSIFVGDLFLRFMVLGLAIIALTHFHIPMMTPLLCLAAGYLGFSLVQIPFFHRMPLI